MERHLSTDSAVLFINLITKKRNEYKETHTFLSSFITYISYMPCHASKAYKAFPYPC